MMILLWTLASSENAAIPVPSLDFAALALRNAELLLSRLTVTNNVESEPLFSFFRY